MSTTQPATAPRLRADARRNRDRLVDVAVRAFSDGGQEATLDAIAKAAGVGIGTLYRHFPTREALVDAAYQNELARLCDGVDDLLAQYAPDVAMRVWMDRFVEYMTTKRGMSDALKALIASGGDPFAQSRTRMTTAVQTLLDAGARAGTIRSDISASDLVASFGGVSMAVGDPAQREQAGRILDLLMDGLRYRH